MDEEDAIDTHSGILLGHREELNNVIYSNIQQEIIILSNSERDKYMILLPCGS